ncbi:hypothetical protein CTB91_00796 [Dickeya solani]|uniref:CdiI immunity protein domain-containing protein n=1 Tax=Dickeya solani D s0432-1 TaxID=1231725 RepID=A0AAV3KGG3_9GAMM|nr:hypothetical protein CTB91_00796 [Dickeya solani]ERO59802.1 hypothetical protein A544_0782 [Dickeya solani D s0432-1]AYQ50807.1 hypothetical protein DSOL99_00802 [Dickeya solani]MBD3606223.1 hypothetical protein [Dickeya solani]NUA38808.1 hypothetical protein [Dickeya solani]
MDIKELSESIYSFVNYDGRSPLTENEIPLIYEFKKQLLGREVESRDMFVEMYLKHYKH